MLGFSFSIVYKRGKDNAAADALSRLPAVEIENEAVQLKELTSVLVSNWAGHMVEENETDPEIRDLKEKLIKENSDSNFKIRVGVLYHRGKFYLGSTSKL